MRGESTWEQGRVAQCSEASWGLGGLHRHPRASARPPHWSQWHIFSLRTLLVLPGTGYRWEASSRR